ncbi:unnamed protein product [Camellia sinensis]
MASHHRIQVLALYIIFLLLQTHFDMISASRQPKIHPPILSPGSLSRPKPPSAIGGFSSNRYKKDEIEAYRPTCPGNSPGIGHHDPPPRVP